MDQARELHVLVADTSGRTDVRSELRAPGFPVSSRIVRSENELRSALDAQRWDLVLASDTALALEHIRQRALDTRVMPLEERRAGELGRALESALVRRELRELERLRMFERVARGVAHDTSNMLTVIETLAKMMQERDHDAYEDFRDLLAAVERTSRLCRQLVWYDRPMRGKRELLSVSEVIQSMSMLLWVLVGHNVRLDLRAGDDLPVVEAERTQIEQVIVNLVLNARDAMPGGGELMVQTLEIELDDEGAAACHPPAQPGSYLVLRVRDTGSGMDDDTRAHIFERYFTTKAHGHGIGLATVREVVSDLQGSLRVLSEPGRGTTFDVLFRASGKKRRHTAARRTSAVRTRGETILLIDEDELVRRATRRILESGGFRVREASGSREALDVLDEQSIAVAIIDRNVPGLHHGELVEDLLARSPHLGVVCLSAIHERGAYGGRVVQLDKPTSQRKLLGAVRELVEDNRASTTEAPRASQATSS